MAERTLTKTKFAEPRYDSDGDSSDDEVLDQNKDENYLLTKITFEEGKKAKRQVREQNDKQLKRRLAEAKKKDFNSLKCQFVDKRTARRCTDDACAAEDPFWTDARTFKPHKYHGKFCKDHWYTKKASLQKKGVKFDDADSYKRTKHLGKKKAVTKTVQKKAKTNNDGPGGSIPKPLTVDDLSWFSNDPDDQALFQRASGLGITSGAIAQKASEAKLDPPAPIQSPPSAVAPAPSSVAVPVQSPVPNAADMNAQFDPKMFAMFMEMMKAYQSSPATSSQSSYVPSPIPSSPEAKKSSVPNPPNPKTLPQEPNSPANSDGEKETHSDGEVSNVLNEAFKKLTAIQNMQVDSKA